MLLQTINSLQTGTYTVTRVVGDGYDADGYKTAGTTSTFSIVAVVQPLDPRHLLPLPEGIRAEDVRLLHTATQLRTRDQSGDADVVTIGGEQFRAWKVAGPYTLGGSTHYEAHVARSAKP